MSEQPQAKETEKLTGIELDNAVMKARIETLTRSGIIEVALQNPNVMSYMEHWESRSGKAESLVEELASLLRQADMHVIWESNGFSRDFQDKIEAALERVYG